MPMQLENEIAVMSATCGPEDAAELVEWLRTGGRRVRLDGPGHMHAAVVQCLMAFRPVVEMANADPFTQMLIARAGVPVER